jgi:hypothetical protein
VKKYLRITVLATLCATLIACGGATPTPSASTGGSARSGCTDAWPAAGQASSTGPLPLLANSDLAPGANRLILGLVISGTDAAGATVLVRFTSFVQATGTAPRPGDAAPNVATPIAATSPQGVAGVSTDPEPRADFYTNSASELLAAGTPFLIAFASPAFCVSQACGPTLTLLKSAADRNPNVVIAHVEPYQMSWNGTRLIPVLAAGGGLQATSIVTAWQVPVEPWIFTVGSDGRILRSLEGVISPEELDAALAELAAN